MVPAIRNSLLIFGGLLAYNAVTKGRALRTLNFYPKSIDSIRWDGITPVIRFGLAIQNTSNQRLIVKSLAGNLYVNDFLIGNVASYIPAAILPNSESIIWLTVRLSVLGAVEDLIRALSGNGVSQIMNFDAVANVDNYSVPIKIKYQVG